MGNSWDKNAHKQMEIAKSKRKQSLNETVFFSSDQAKKMKTDNIQSW